MKKHKPFSIFLEVVVVAIAMILLCIFINHRFWHFSINADECAYRRERFTGKTELIAGTGHINCNPLNYSVHTIDLRPRQISLVIHNRILDTKTVQFNPDGLSQFLEKYGRDNLDSTETVNDILASHVFDPKGCANCPFITVVK